MAGHLVEHISRDATAIEAREKPQLKVKASKPKRRKRGRPRKGEERAKKPSRLERQLTMSLAQILADLPRACDVGTRRNAKGHTTSWIGYKLHVDTADGALIQAEKPFASAILQEAVPIDSAGERATSDLAATPSQSRLSSQRQPIKRRVRCRESLGDQGLQLTRDFSYPRSIADFCGSAMCG